MFLQSAVCVLLVGVVMSRPHPDNPLHVSQYGAPPPPPPPQPYHQPHEKEDAKPYTFDYGVKDTYSGANFGHNENSDGQEVKGSYSVALPDGRIQTVHYIADHHNGFQAQVTYEGEAKYPETSYNAPQPSYEAPQPSYHPQPRPPVYHPAPPPSYPAAKEEEYQVEQQVVYEPVDLPETVYRDQVEYV